MEVELMDKIKVMVVDEQLFFRSGVCHALSQEPDFQVTECDPNVDPLGLIEANLPDVVLLGSDLAALNGLELGRTIARYYPNTKVVVLSPDPNDEELFEVIKTAAVACLSKKTPVEDLVGTIRRASKGEYPVNETLTTRPGVAKQVLKQFQDIASMGKSMEKLSAPLTSRETQILVYVANGNSNKQIASSLHISEQTVKNQVSSILRKVNANDRAHAVVLAIRHGWMSAQETPQD
jgi:two-component system response regulator DegU